MRQQPVPENERKGYVPTLAFSDGVRTLQQVPFVSDDWDAAQAECDRRNKAIEDRGEEEAGFWFVEPEREDPTPGEE